MARKGNPQRERIFPEISYGRKREVRVMLGFSQDSQEVGNEEYRREQAQIYRQKHDASATKDSWLPLETKSPSQPSVDSYRESARPLGDPSVEYFQTAINSILSEERRDCICSY